MTIVHGAKAKAVLRKEQAAQTRGVQVFRITAVSPVQADGQRIRILRDGIEREVIEHQVVSENPDVRLAAIVFEQFQVVVVILLGVEKGLAVHAPLGDVAGKTGNQTAGTRGICVTGNPAANNFFKHFAGGTDQAVRAPE